MDVLSMGLVEVYLYNAARLITSILLLLPQ